MERLLEELARVTREGVSEDEFKTFVEGLTNIPANSKEEKRREIPEGCPVIVWDYDENKAKKARYHSYDEHTRTYPHAVIIAGSHNCYVHAKPDYSLDGVLLPWQGDTELPAEMRGKTVYVQGGSVDCVIDGRPERWHAECLSDARAIMAMPEWAL